MSMEISVDLYRNVKPRELQTSFKFNRTSEKVNLKQLFENVPPKLLGSFKLIEEVELINSDGTVITKIPNSFRPEI